MNEQTVAVSSSAETVFGAQIFFEKRPASTYVRWVSTIALGKTFTIGFVSSPHIFRINLNLALEMSRGKT